MEWILVSTPRGLERHAYAELKDVLGSIRPDSKQLGLHRLSLPIVGLLLISIEAPATEIIRQLRELALEDPWRFRLVLKVKPIQRMVDTVLQEIVSTVKDLGVAIPASASFKILVTRRMNTIDRAQIIQHAAEMIDRIVNLDHPDYLVLIEILGGTTGISVIPSEAELSLSAVRRGDI